jgi:hypothetical protein
MNPTCRRLMRDRERHVQALPLLRNRPEESAWGSWPERRERICLCLCVSRFEERCAAMHSLTLLRNAGGATGS